MQHALRHIPISILTALMFTAAPGWSQSGTSQPPVQDMEQLSLTLNKLKTEQSRSQTLQDKLMIDESGYSVRDRQQLQALKRKQAESRMRIDALTMELIRLTEQLQDPEKRFALAKKLKEGSHLSVPSDVPDIPSDSTARPAAITARSIDLAAMTYIRKGQSLDQARLKIIEQLPPEKVLDFYQNLSRIERYELYDMADEIARTEHMDLVSARRTAIYFHLFAR